MFEVNVYHDIVNYPIKNIGYYKLKISLPDVTVSIRDLINLSFKNYSFGYFIFTSEREKLYLYGCDAHEDQTQIFGKAFEKENLWLLINDHRITGKLDQLITLSPGEQLHFVQFDSLRSKLVAYRSELGDESYLSHYPEFFRGIFSVDDVIEMVKGRDYIEKELNVNFSEKYGADKSNFVRLYESLLNLSEAKFVKFSTQLISEMGVNNYIQACRDVFNDPPIYLDGGGISSMHKQLLLSLPQINHEGIFDLIEQVFKNSEKKIPYQGQCSKKLSRVCKQILEDIGTKRALQTCFKLNRTSKYMGFYDSIQNLIQKLKLSDAEVEELKVPTYGFDEQLHQTRQIGGYKVILSLVGNNKIEKSIIDFDGKEIQDLPKKGMENYKEEISELKYLIKNIPQELRFQRNRIENTYATGQSWPFTNWWNLYVKNPMTGYSSRRLIWNFTKPNEELLTGIWKDGILVNTSGEPLPAMDDEWTVKLWHPVEVEPSEVLVWKDYIFNHQITQPFKQAFREIYTVTPPELVTRTFSNRFAAHILYKQQFAALASSRGWAVPNYYSDNVFYPYTSILGCGIEFRMDTSFGGDQTATTNEVVFKNNQELNKNIELQKLPLIVFSEAMRDVDMFVSVSSIGVDPTWTPEKSDYQYWSSYTTGELANSAVSRKELLEHIVPGLIIAEKCSLEDRWLRVNGTLGAYRIHIGSGSVHMDPTNKHICIVPQAAPSTPVEKVYLPFEGDMMLSLILSKAFLLANDTKIKDQTILAQIKN